MSYPRKFTPESGFTALAFPDEIRKGHSVDMNDLQAMQENHVRGIAEAVLADGDVTSGGTLTITDGAAGARRVRVAAGKVFAAGRVHAVPARDLVVPAVGMAAIGVCVHTEIVTHLDDETLVGSVPGSRAFGEPLMDRVRQTATWRADTETAPCDGAFFAVYRLRDGELITNPAPVAVFDDRLALYDEQANGHYRVNGWEVRALGLRSGRQQFSISAGTANIKGYKQRRDADTRLTIAETPDLELVDAEPHEAPAADAHGRMTVFVNHTPIAAVLGVTVFREATINIVHGPVGGYADPLPHAGVSSIVSITQGATTYAAGVSFRLAGDKVDWSLSGAEPAPGSTYRITYRYLDTVQPVASDATSLTLTGVAPGTTIIVNYRYALARIDAICADRAGALHYLPGVSVRHNPWPPAVPRDLFLLAEVVNRWGDTPVIRNTKTRAFHNNEIAGLFDVVEDVRQLLALERLRRDADRREPAAKRGAFVDPLLDDDLRDQGVAQTAAVFGGLMRLPIDGGTLDKSLGDAPVTLAYVEEVLVEQPFATGAVRVNPYQVFAPLPGTMTLSPSLDFWTELETTWLSDVTATFELGARAGGGRETAETISEISRGRRAAATLRVREVTFSLDGFGAGERLDTLTFDGLAVTPEAQP